MSRVTLVHWNSEEAETRAERLREAGHQVTVFESDKGAIGLTPLRENPPDAFVIDLGRLPSHGRDIALWIRERKATRHVPIVFVEGDPAKVERIRSILPDATFTEWKRVRSDLRRSIASPPQAPVLPGSVMAGYSGTPLPKKLGIKAGATVALLDAPEGFEATLGALPERVRVRRDARATADVVVVFVRSLQEMRRRVPSAVRALAEKGGLWIAWPKRASGVKTDVTQNEVRSFGLGSGLVDYKICAMDATWSGLLFARRRS